MPMLLFNTINDIQLHFATPILHTAWPAAQKYNSQLKEMILQKQATNASVSVSNRGGWQSRDDFFNWGGDAIAAFAQWVNTCVLHIYETYHNKQFLEQIQAKGIPLSLVATGWANINKRGDWNATHNHPACHWSGVYYVQAPPGSGQFGFFDPRPNINMMDTSQELLNLFAQTPRTIEPKEGLTVIFPSWLQHHVSTHESDAERISIAFNVRLVSE